MIKLSSETKVSLLLQGDESVDFYFRKPTNKELNDFLDSRYEMGRRGKMKDNSIQARVDFFDLILTRVENLAGEDGMPITPDRKDEIPSNWKAAAIYKAFEDLDVGLDEKK